MTDTTKCTCSACQLSSRNLPTRSITIDEYDELTLTGQIAEDLKRSRYAQNMMTHLEESKYKS